MAFLDIETRDNDSGANDIAYGYDDDGWSEQDQLDLEAESAE